MNDLRSKLGYSVGSPWENSPYNLINTPNGSITMTNTKKPLKAFDANTGKFLANMKPGYNYNFNTNKVLEIPIHQEGGWNINKLFRNKKKQAIIDNQFGIYSGIYDYNGKVNYRPTSDEVFKNMAEFMKNNMPPEADRPSNNYRSQWQHTSFDIPKPYVNNFAQLGGYLQEGGDYYDPTQDQQKGMPIVPIMMNNQQVGGTGAQQTPYNTPPIQPGIQQDNTKTITKRGFSAPWFKSIAAVNFGLSAFANSVEEGRQSAWNQQQMNNPLFNGSYSFAQNDYGVNPYEQTGQLKHFQKGGRKPITVTNPNDSRLKAYSDSLTLHNAGELAYNNYKLFNYKSNGQERMTFNNWNNHVEPRVDPKISKSIKNLISLNHGFPQPTNVVPVVIYDENKFIGNGAINRFKKPVQPIMYKKPEISYPIHNLQPAVKGNIKITSPQQVQIPEPTGQPVYGPSNGLVGYQTKNGFQPTLRRDHLAKNNQADIDLLNNSEALQKYISSNPRYQYGGYPMARKMKNVNIYNYGVPQQPQLDDPMNSLTGMIGQPASEQGANFNSIVSNMQNGYYQKGGKFNAYDFLYGDDEEEQKSVEASKEKIKAKTRITEENVDQLSILGLSPEDIVNSVNSYKNYQNRNKNRFENINYNSVSNVSSTEAINKVKDYYSSQGYDKSFIAGVLGNIHAESNGNPIAQESGGSGFGLFQHTGPRRKQLFNWAKQNEYDPSDPITQAKFAETEPSFQKAHKQSIGKTAGEAASIFENIFEKPGIKRSKLRIGAANSFYNSFKKGGTYVVDFATMRELQSKGIKFKLLNS